nr:xylulose kinase-1 [Tanacetum cinerariifolium]
MISNPHVQCVPNAFCNDCQNIEVKRLSRLEIIDTGTPCLETTSFKVIVPTGRYVVPTGRVIVPTGRYVVHNGRVIVPTGRYVVLADISFCKKESLLCLACDYKGYSPSLTGSKDLSRVGSNKCVHNEATNTQQQLNIQPQIITTVSNNNAKFPYLKKDEYEHKRTRRDHDGRVIIHPPTTAEEHIAIHRESKARITLLQSIPDDHVADFHYMDDARDIWNAVKARFGGNAKSKNMRKSMLKQEFSKFRTGDVGEFALMGVTSELTLEDKIRVLSIELDNTSNLLNYSERINANVETTKKDLQTQLDNHLARTEKWRNSSKNLFKLFDSSMFVRTKVGLGFTNYIGKNELGWDDSAFSVFTTNFEDVEGRPIFHRFAKTDSMKAVPPPLTGDYTSLSDHTDLDESQMSYGTKYLTSCDPKYVPNDFVSCENSDKSSEVNTNTFASSDSSVKSSEHQLNDSTLCASTSSISTSVNEAEIESNVGTPIKEPIIVQDLPSFTCNSFDKNEHTFRTSCNKNGYFNKKAGHFKKHASSVSKLCFVCGSGTHLIKDCNFHEKRMANQTVGVWVHIPPVRPQPVPTGKPKVTPVSTVWAFKICLGRSKPMVITKARTLNGGSHSFLLKASAMTFAFPGVFNSPMLHLLRVEMVINSSWITPILGTKELASPEQTAPVPTSRVIVPTGRYVVPTGRVIVLTGMYVVPTSRVIVPTGRYVVPTGRVIVHNGRYVVPADKCYS